MSDPEKAMAFQQNKTALASAELDQKARILAMADRLDLMLTAESSLADWERKLRNNWANFSNLTILSWHGGNGTIIQNTVTAADASILLPVQNGAVTDCRAPGVKFVRVQLALNYADLNRIDPPPNTTLRGEYYIQLPQDSTDLTNGVGNPYRLTTFTGAADLRTLTVEAIKRDILDATHQDGPYDLLAPSFNLTSCRTESTVTYGELKNHKRDCLSSLSIFHVESVLAIARFKLADRCIPSQTFVRTKPMEVRQSLTSRRLSSAPSRSTSSFCSLDLD